MSDRWNKIYANKLAPRVNNEKQYDTWKKIATTTNEYGAFYLKDLPRNPHSQQLPAVDLSPRPSLTTRTLEAPLTTRSDAEMGSYRLRLPDIKDIEVQFGTADYASANIFPSSIGNGRYEYQTFPSGMNTLKLPDITEITVKISMRDGMVFNFPCEPKVRRKKMDIWEVGMYDGGQ